MISIFSAGIIVSLILFWIVHEIKTVLFWVYLWQLKDYLWARLRDYFSTNQGGRLLFNVPAGIKLIILVSSLQFAATPWVATASFALLWLLYAFQGVKAARDVFGRRLKIPARTPKTITLSGAALLLIFLLGAVALFQYGSLLLFVIVDIATPLVVTAVMFALEPIAIGARRSMMRRAERKRALFSNLKVVGITGSYGKTSTKEYLWHILSQRFRTLKTPDHRNSEVGIAQTILEDLTQDHEVFVCEMGAYRRGGIRMLCDMAKPHIGILTGINEQHMATFGSQQAIVDTKFELLEALPDGGVAIINWDNGQIKKSNIKYQNDKSTLKIIRVSTREKTELWAEEIAVEKERISFIVRTQNGDEARFQVNVMGSHNIQNIMLAAAAAKALSMTLQEISRAVATLPEGAMRLKQGMGGATILDSSYSANPDGVASDIEHLSLFDGAKIVIMPCLIELGQASASVHERIGKILRDACDLAVITTRDRFDDIKRGSGNASHVVYANSPEAVARLISPYVNARTTILLEGRSGPDIISRILSP